MWVLSDKLGENAFKFQQLRDEIIRCIENGEYDKNERLPSIIEVCNHYKISQVTVGRAYGHLKKTGYIINIRGKFYVSKEKQNRFRVLLIFNKINDYKKILYDAIVEAFPSNTKIDLQVYYYDYKIFKDVVTENLGKYDYYIIMPHFHHNVNVQDCVELLFKIPKHKIFLVDKRIPTIESMYPSVYQDFESDMFSGLEKVNDFLKKYTKVHICIANKSHHPIEVINGAEKYCLKYKKEFKVISEVENESIQPNILYISTGEEDMAKLIKKIRNSVYIIGKDIGIISYNETLFKELLDITVFSTNFYQMGKKISQMILDKDYNQVLNPFDIIVRNSI